MKQKRNTLKARCAAYGLTEERYAQLFFFQDGRCGICKRQFTTKRRPIIDHAVKPDVVRGLLCYRCDTGLSQLGDSDSSLRRAMAYVLSPPNASQLPPLEPSAVLPAFKPVKKDPFEPVKPRTYKREIEAVRNKSIALALSLEMQSDKCFKCDSVALYRSVNMDKTKSIGACLAHSSHLPPSSNW